MSEKQKEKFKFPKSVLVPVKDFLLGELRRLRLTKVQLKKEDPFTDEDRTMDNAAPDIEADEQFGHARSEAARKQISKRIIQIKKALARIKIGRYGLCEKCGNFIDTKRLMVYPEATICLNCTREKGKSKRA